MPWEIMKKLNYKSLNIQTNTGLCVYVKEINCTQLFPKIKTGGGDICDSSFLYLVSLCYLGGETDDYRNPNINTEIIQWATK